MTHFSACSFKNWRNKVLWHANNIGQLCDPQKNGEKFKFHKGVISNFDAWRIMFGYPKVVTWDPANNPPHVISLFDRTRNQDYQPQPIPSYLTVQRGATKSLCSSESHTGYDNITKLTDFKSADHLSGEVENDWHGHVHNAVGGDMMGLNSSPKDPVFWEWHKYLDGNIYDTYRIAKGLVH
jgi:hypothetical protein